MTPQQPYEDIFHFSSVVFLAFEYMATLDFHGLGVRWPTVKLQKGYVDDTKRHQT